MTGLLGRVNPCWSRVLLVLDCCPGLAPRRQVQRPVLGRLWRRGPDAWGWWWRLHQCGPDALARSARPEAAAGEVVALAALPAQAQHTYALIHQGGPFPYDKDGTVFGNRERLLPAKARGHYREYTVKTPGVRNRGARRIVCGGAKAAAPETCYYTSDHYSSFSRIQP
jgi:ribonuclease T1